MLEREGLAPDAAAPSLVDSADRACQQLSLRLSFLLTATTTTALLARSVSIASLQFPFLGSVRPGSAPHGCLSGLSDALHDIEPAHAHEAVVAVLGNLLGLVSTFVGDDLMLRVGRNLWSPPAESTEAERGETKR